VILVVCEPTLARDLTTMQSRDALRARLDAEQTRNLTLRARHAGERVGLRRAIARIGRDLETAVVALEDLSADAPDTVIIAERAVAALAAVVVGDPMHDQEIYPGVEIRQATPAGVGLDSGGLARPELELTALEVTVLEVTTPDYPSVSAAPMTQTGTLQAGIRAYDLQAGIRAYDLQAGIRAYETKNYARAYEVWQPLAEAGGAGAQFHLGALYFEGRGVRQNLGQARRWLSRALEQGDERARFLLGRVEMQLAKAG
jgi:hypothetical protein